MPTLEFIADIANLKEGVACLEREKNALLVALGRLVSKPAPFCDTGIALVCPYCDCTEHLEDCDWFLAQQVWVTARQGALETPNHKEEE